MRNLILIPAMATGGSCATELSPAAHLPRRSPSTEAPLLAAYPPPCAAVGRGSCLGEAAAWAAARAVVAE